MWTRAGGASLQKQSILNNFVQKRFFMNVTNKIMHIWHIKILNLKHSTLNISNDLYEITYQMLNEWWINNNLKTITQNVKLKVHFAPLDVKTHLFIK